MAGEASLAEAEASAARARYERDELLAISRALSSERDIRKLLDLILFKSRQITGADAGSVYVVEAVETEPASKPRRRLGTLESESDAQGSTCLRFMLSQNDSIAVDFQERRLKIDDSSMVGRAARAGRPINIPDLTAPQFPDTRSPSHDRSFDAQTGYQARSMLTVPMLSAGGNVIGVIQLINRKRDATKKLLTKSDFASDVIPFDTVAEEMALALASQAGVSLENAILYDEIRGLFESFVDAAVTAIEARDPTTSGHSRRVATLSVALAERVDAVADGPLASVRFSRESLRQLEYAGVLHDFGKVGVREQVLVKAKKLYDWQRAGIALRLRYLRKGIEAEVLRRKLALVMAGERAAAELLDGELSARLSLLDECWSLVSVADEPSVLDSPTQARLVEIGRMSYVDESGQPQSFLTPEELAALQVPRGSLTVDERQQIQRHVDHTMAFLRTIPWGRELRQVPRIAGAHHELLDGSGYPAKLRGDAIPIEARMLTIADIFDALTAADRPYKAAVPVVRALSILENDVKAGKCDANLFRVFVEAEIYKRVLSP